MGRPKKIISSELDENTGLLKKLQAIAPKGEGADQWEVSRTTDMVLSQIRYVLTTGIAAFDDIAGGIPFGRLVELYGLESCGKTALALRCAARAMKKCICEVVRDEQGNIVHKPVDPDKCKVLVVYIDNEQSLDDDMKLVVDGEKLDVIGCRFDTTDDVFKAVDAAIAFQEERVREQEKDGILRFMFIVVDTIASTSTKQELEQKWGTQDFPRQPQQISRALRQLVRPVNRYNVAVLFTNQVRVRFQEGGQHGRRVYGIQPEDYISPGGMALRFYTSHRIFMYALPQKWRLNSSNQFSDGLLIGFHTKKNRLCPPLRDGRMVLLFDKYNGGFNNVFSMLETLYFLGYIECNSTYTDYEINFAKANITPVTFAEQVSQENMEDEMPVSSIIEDVPRRRGRKKRVYGFKNREDWPDFYEQHKADIDRLWRFAVDQALKYEDSNKNLEILEIENEPTKLTK